MDATQLLTPEFIEFSKKITEIYNEKEEKTAAFKSAYTKHKAEMAELETQAQKLKEEFESNANGQ